MKIKTFIKIRLKELIETIKQLDIAIETIEEANKKKNKQINKQIINETKS